MTPCHTCRGAGYVRADGSAPETRGRRYLALRTIAQSLCLRLGSQPSAQAIRIASLEALEDAYAAGRAHGSADQTRDPGDRDCPQCAGHGSVDADGRGVSE